MAEADVFARATAPPRRSAGPKGRSRHFSSGRLRRSSAVLHWNEEALPLRDVNGEERPGGCWEPVTTIRGGQVV